METNFSFLKGEWNGFHETACTAEAHVFAAPMYSGMLSRKSLEEFVRWMYDNDKDLNLPYDTSLNALLHEQTFKDNLPEKLFERLNYIRKTGNNAVHATKNSSLKKRSIACDCFMNSQRGWCASIASNGPKYQHSMRS